MSSSNPLRLYQPSKRLLNMLNTAINYARKSTMYYRHGAILFGKGNRVLHGSCNCSGSTLYGYKVPSQHAEANCLRPLFNQCSQKQSCVSKWREKRQYFLCPFKEI